MCKYPYKYVLYVYPCLYSHGVVFGIWSANTSVGNIIGAFMVSGLNL